MRDEPPLGDEPKDHDEGPGSGSLVPTPIGSLVGLAVVGGALGWGVHSVSDRVGITPPLVSWAQPLTLWLLAAILAWTAWVTWRAVQVRRTAPRSQQAVNRYVLARASALAGSLVAGGYLGYGLSWIGDPAHLADERLVRSLVAAGGAAAAVVAALVLERACRVRDPR